jgi:hypothetical protein
LIAPRHPLLSLSSKPIMILIIRQFTRPEITFSAR